MTNLNKVRMTTIVGLWYNICVFFGLLGRNKMDIQKLEKLAEMRKKGFLTEEEFETQKKIILNEETVRKKQGNKKQSTFLWLAFFLGFLGVHNFYIKEAGKGAIKLAVWIFSLLISSEMSMLTGAVMADFFRIPIYLWIIFEMFNTTKDGNGEDLIPVSSTYRNTIGFIEVGFLVISLLIMFSTFGNLLHY